MNQSAAARESLPATRNSAPILAVLRAHLGDRARVLEIASGTGQHAALFTHALPQVVWTPSDPDETARDSIAAWRADADPARLHLPLALDVADRATWPDATFDAVVCINMVHISPWTATEELMALSASVLISPGGLLALYGPYLEADTPLAPANAAFDADLKRRNPEWGLRDRDAVVAEARRRGLVLTRRVEMPANNLMLLFRRA